MATDRCESSKERNYKAGDKQDDDQLNCLGKVNLLLTPTGLLMEGAIRPIRFKVQKFSAWPQTES
jgi:hypothetical protein